MRQHGRIQRPAAEDQRGECLQAGRHEVRNPRRDPRVLREVAEVHDFRQRAAQQLLSHQRQQRTHLPGHRHRALRERNRCRRHRPRQHRCRQRSDTLRHDLPRHGSRSGNHHPDARQETDAQGGSGLPQRPRLQRRLRQAEVQLQRRHLGHQHLRRRTARRHSGAARGGLLEACDG